MSEEQFTPRENAATLKQPPPPHPALRAAAAPCLPGERDSRISPDPPGTGSARP